MLEVGPICPHCELVVGSSAEELRDPPPYPVPLLCPHCERTFENDPEQARALDALVTWLQSEHDDGPAPQVWELLPTLLRASLRTHLETRRAGATAPLSELRIPDGWGEDGPSFQ